MTDTIHKFEAAKLGKAPFTVLGCTVEKFHAYPGAPAQPGGTCDYCGNGIMNVFHVRSADGRKFKVGCDCVLKAGDEGMKKVVKGMQSEARRQAQAKRFAEREAAAVVLLNHTEVSSLLKAEPHPYGRMGCSLFDYYLYCLTNAGSTVRQNTCRRIEEIAKNGKVN
jgi:hypothetical protein